MQVIFCYFFVNESPCWKKTVYCNSLLDASLVATT